MNGLVIKKPSKPHPETLVKICRPTIIFVKLICVFRIVISFKVSFKFQALYKPEKFTGLTFHKQFTVTKDNTT